MPSLRTWGVVAVPIVAAGLAFVTVGICYYLTMSDPSNPQFATRKNDGSDMTPVDIGPGVLVPCISFLGVAGLPQQVYQCGFGTTAVLMALSIHLSFGYIRPHLLRPGTGVDRDTLDGCVQKGYVAALGVGMQGVFTLTPIITPLCFLHWGGAAIFAGAAQAHATVAIEVYEKAIASGASPVFQRPSIQRALRWRQSCLAAPALMPMLLPAAFMVPLVAQAIGYSDSRTKEVSGSHENAAVMQNGLGLMQWLIVAAFVLYFVSYAVDVHQCACHDEQDAASIAEFKARLDKLKTQRTAFLEKKARQRQQAGGTAVAAEDADETEDAKPRTEQAEDDKNK